MKRFVFCFNGIWNALSANKPTNVVLRAAAAAIRAALALCALGSGAVLATQAELHSFHCLFGCPVGASATNDLIVREIYTLSSNDITKMADWVAYRVTPDTIGPSSERKWERDPWLASDETLAPKAYDGASSALHIDRGHQAPLASFAGTPFAPETNILSNITPQASALNQGAWVRLESRERDLAKSANVGVYVTTGPLFERMMKPLPTQADLHRVPSGYWKIVALNDGRMTAFIFDQATPGDFDYCQGRVSLRDVTLRSRLLMFPDLLNAGSKNLDKELGCAVAPPEAAVPSEIPAG